MSSLTQRDSDAEQLERDAFRLLEYVHATAAGDTQIEFPEDHLADALRLDRDYTARVLRFLGREGMLDYEAAGPTINITFPGIAYVEHLAWRRRSVRRRWS